ncbi:MAG: fumarate hydratase C-terminal domain-containing protein [Candidatus Binatia bacterium]
MKKYRLTTPLSGDRVKDLEAGDFFTITGRGMTCRPLAYDRLFNTKEGEAVRSQLRNLGVDVLFHCGPLVKKEGVEWRILGMVPMPSWLAGSERISKAVNSLGLKIIIGKGSLHLLSDCCVKSSCVHAVCTGNYNDYALKVTKVLEGHWLDLGLPEALWIFEAEEFGPFIVDTDTKGNSLYKGVDEVFKTEAGSLLDELGIKLD